jgi:hypothetical protein
MFSKNPLCQPINTYQINARVDIEGVPSMSNLRVHAHSDSCTYVYGKNGEEGADHIFTVSGSSPAIPHVKQSVDEVTGEVTYAPVKERAPRGSLQEIMKNPKIPSGKFTVAEFAELNGVPYPYGMKWVKENCVSRGMKEKEEGKRGRASELFEKIF